MPGPAAAAMQGVGQQPCSSAPAAHVLGQHGK